ncbi:hypothetical protein KGF54_000822 [Candida jiufengensis]|uniref:uncharacterized protein n=1 Tax=Candida jiufengensis TaxID=497108 RepID=UPI00222413E1|nr:uncharacterized protein KGF54_000822 [Candida jiufengensis]KAI5956347.1 hypothetical protein KGF54_000822 [Candida jiufengensis]
MQILKERDAFLSNFEVSEHLKQIKHKYNWTFSEQDEIELQQQQQHKKKNRFVECGLNLETITKEVLLFITNTNENLLNPITKENFKQLMEFLNTFELMKIEKLQIMNQLPRSLVVLYLLVEDCEERFDEEKCLEIIAKIDELFPVEQDEEQEEAEEEDEDEEMAE